MLLYSSVCFCILPPQKAYTHAVLLNRAHYALHVSILYPHTRPFGLVRESFNSVFITPISPLKEMCVVVWRSGRNPGGQRQSIHLVSFGGAALVFYSLYLLMWLADCKWNMYDILSSLQTFNYCTLLISIIRARNITSCYRDGYYILCVTLPFRCAILLTTQKLHCICCISHVQGEHLFRINSQTSSYFVFYCYTRNLSLIWNKEQRWQGPGHAFVGDAPMDEKTRCLCP